MRGNTNFNHNGGLVGICGTGAQYYYERNSTERKFNNFLIDKVTGRGGGGSDITETYVGSSLTDPVPIAASVFAPYSSGVPSKMTVLRYFAIQGGTFDLLGQYGTSSITYDSDVPANCMILGVSGTATIGDSKWRGTCKLLPRSSDVEMGCPNHADSYNMANILSGTNFTQFTDCNAQTDYLMPYIPNPTYPYGLYMRGDSYVSGGTARILTSAIAPWSGDNRLEFAYDSFASGTTMYARTVMPTGNNSAFFGGTTSYVRVADDATLRPETAMTLACWINQNTTDGTHRLMHKYDANEGYLLSTDAGKLYWEIWIDEDGTPTRYESYSHGTIVADAWTHVGITYDSVTGFLREYQEGNEVDVTDLGTAGYSIATGSKPFSLGYSANSIQGQMCDARIYSTVKDGDDFVAMAAINPATDLSTGNFGKYAAILALDL